MTKLCGLCGTLGVLSAANINAQPLGILNRKGGCLTARSGSELQDYLKWINMVEIAEDGQDIQTDPEQTEYHV